MYSDKMKVWFTFLSNKIIPNKFQFQLFHDDIDDLESFMTAGTGDIEMLRAESSLPRDFLIDGRRSLIWELCTAGWLERAVSVHNST